MACEMIFAPEAARLRSNDFAEGARAMAPLVIAIVPFGVAIGAAAAAAHLPTMIGLSGSVLLLGGSAQLTLIRLMDTGSGAALAVLTALLINSRLLIYGAGVAQWFPKTGTRGRMLLALPLVDQLYLMATNDFQTSERDEAARRRYYAGAAVFLWLAWISAQAFGAVLGRGLPTWLHLEAASPIALAGLLAMAIVNRASVLAAVAAGGVMAATSPLGLPYLIVGAILVGVSVGWIGSKQPAEATS
jgi:predicted branched-subunit amino acid permease